MTSVLTDPPAAGRSTDRAPRRWRPARATWLIAACAIVGLLVLLYPSMAAWTSQYNQSAVLSGHATEVTHAEPAASEQIALAEQYNAALNSGVELRPGASVPSGTGTSDDESLRYREMLTTGPGQPMSRLMIPRIGVDLPVYHGTDDDTLLEGAGHLEGSHLPVGGVGIHSVITAHSGLASARMFTDLEQLREGDRFTIETFGRVLTYRIGRVQIVDPEDTGSLRASPGQDLVTLITCTPLGINTQRILVTGERITPTPPEEAARAEAEPDTVPAPWWAAGLLGGLAVIGVYLGHAGVVDARWERYRAARSRAEATAR